MPLRPELRNLRDANGDLIYRGPAWKARRERLLERCGNKCEQCLVPNHTTVNRLTGGAWFCEEERSWVSVNGVAFRILANGTFTTRIRTVRIVLTMAHLTHDPLENDDADLAMLCQWCHLNYDKLHHKDTRSARKDAARPLLAGVA